MKRAARPELSFTARYLPVLHFGVDSLVWAVALPITTFLRYDFEWYRLTRSGMVAAVFLGVVAQGAFGYAFGLYRRRWRYGSFDELRALGTTVLADGSVLWVVFIVAHTSKLPRSVPPLAAAVTLTGTIAIRSIWRLYRERNNLPHRAEPIVVVGAGNGAARLVQALRADPKSPYIPVALLDDDPLKRNLRIQGVRVEGMLADLAAVTHRLHAKAVLVAIPSAPRDLLRRVAAEADRLGVRCLVLPRPEQLLGLVSPRDIHPVSRTDLLGREPAEIDPAAVSAYITGKRVLVTGAGGSIGSELCRQLERFAPERLYMLDRDESGLHAVQLSIDGRGLLDDDRLVLADIRDVERLHEVFEHLRPQVVFHAAALKHLPLLESAPGEAWKTNVLGTQHVLEAAATHGVERLVNISTDKAARPISVLGYSKRLTERITAEAARHASGTFVSVRFGNVLGSRGSVLTAFAAQAEAGGPLTVTHPDVARYFMTVEEAVRLTIYAGAIGRSGEVMVLDMGQPVSIKSVAERFAAQQHPPLEIIYTGLRPGEKLREDLLGPDELDDRPIHPLITQVPVPPLALGDVSAALAAWGLDWSIDRSPIDAFGSG